MDKKQWIPGEYRAVENKKCLQADVEIGEDGEITGFPDTVRNRIRDAAMEAFGRPVGVDEIGQAIGVGGPAVRSKLAGQRHFKPDEKAAIENWLGRKIF